MKRILPFLTAIVIIGGCGSGDSNVVDKTLPAGAGQPLNPGGKPKTPQEAAMVDAQNRGGQAAASDIAQRMKQMAAARARTGGN